MRGRNKLFVARALALVATAIAVPVYATHVTEGTVDATVTPGLFSVSLDNTAVAYGTLNLSSTNNEPVDVDLIEDFDQTQDCSINANPSVTAENTGTVTSIFTITGGNSNSNDWTIESAAGTDQFVHRFATDGTGCDFTALNTAAQALATGGDSASVDAGSEVTVFLQLDMPSDVTSGITAQTLPITITATSTP